MLVPAVLKARRGPAPTSEQLGRPDRPLTRPVGLRPLNFACSASASEGGAAHLEARQAREGVGHGRDAVPHGAKSINDNFRLDPSNVPEWAWEIIERRDLAFRADTPLAAATVLLADVAFDVTQLSRTAFSEQALTPDSKRILSWCETMITDAIALGELCSSEPAPGTVEELEDGTLTWSDLNRAGDADRTNVIPPGRQDEELDSELLITPADHALLVDNVDLGDDEEAD